MNPFDLFTPELSLVKLTKEEKELTKDIETYVKLPFGNTPKWELKKKENQLIGVKEKLTIIYN